MERGAEEMNLGDDLSSASVYRHSPSSAMSPTKQCKADLLNRTQAALGENVGKQPEQSPVGL